MSVAVSALKRVVCLGRLLHVPHVALKHTIDRSRIPVLNEEDLEEMFVKGSGPGGQSVNKTNNCVVLTHKPTGIVIKCHKSRLQSDNRKEARQLLVGKLDNMINGENSVEAQKKRILQKKSLERKRRQKKRSELKEKLKDMNDTENENEGSHKMLPEPP